MNPGKFYEMLSPFELYGSGKIGNNDLLAVFLQNKKIRWIIAILLCLLLAFEHKIHIFQLPLTFFILLGMTLAMVLVELDTNPGFVYLLLAMTVISFNLITNHATFSEH